MTQSESSRSLLILILIGIGVGIIGGGILPAVGRSVAFLGELFIHALLMLVIPLVMTSMIVSVSSLGDVRLLRGLSGRTIVYYMMTPGVAVLMALILFNIINPGVADTEEGRVGLRGEQLLPNISYTIDPDTMTLGDDRYTVILLDPDQIQGEIQPQKQASDNTLTISEWVKDEEVVTPKPTRTEIQVDLAVAAKVKGKDDRTIFDLLKEVIVGLLPRNLLQAMAENQVLPLIIFSLVFGGVLTLMGTQGQNVIHLFKGLNQAIMRIIHLNSNISSNWCGWNSGSGTGDDGDCIKSAQRSRLMRASRAALRESIFQWRVSL